jgi:XTP/dITP diphosphohydrolase
VNAVLASRNAHKARELERLLPGWRIEVLDTDDYPEETGVTYYENARAKAVFARGRAPTEAWVLGEDSGIEVDALGGGPGPRSARFAGDDASDERNLEELIRALKGVPAAGRTARYRCVAVLAFPDGEEVHTDGVCEGTLEPKPRGTGGFGYDPIFVPVGWDRTMAELTDEEKDRISHRGRALRALGEVLSAG